MCRGKGGKGGKGGKDGKGGEGGEGGKSGKGRKGGKGGKGKRARARADKGQRHNKGQGSGQQPGGWQGTEEGGNEGMGEGRPKTVDIVAMPTIIAVATTCRKKMKPAHEGGGAHCRLCHCDHDNNSRSNFLTVTK